MFDHSLKPAPALRARLEIAKKCTFPLNNLLGSKSLSTKVKRQIYTSLIRPIATYGSPLWSHCSRADLEKLEIFERKQLRKISTLFYNPVTQKYPCNKSLYASTKVTPISEYIPRLNKNFQQHYKRHSNELIRDWALTSSAFNRNKQIFTRDIRYNTGK